MFVRLDEDVHNGYQCPSMQDAPLNPKVTWPISKQNNP